VVPLLRVVPVRPINDGIEADALNRDSMLPRLRHLVGDLPDPAPLALAVVTGLGHKDGAVWVAASMSTRISRLFRWEADSSPACQNEAKGIIGSCPRSGMTRHLVRVMYPTAWEGPPRPREYRKHQREQTVPMATVSCPCRLRRQRRIKPRARERRGWSGHPSPALRSLRLDDQGSRAGPSGGGMARRS
jgi:hypothetical protein